jgi:SWI/SNF related-matrix-associated actin-dependent regulator of chromatin subfamily C
VDPDQRPSNVSAPLSGHFRASAELPRALQSHQIGAPNNVSGQSKPTEVVSSSTDSPVSNPIDTNLELRKNIFSSDKSSDKTNGTVKEEAAEESNVCATCGKHCDTVRYQSSKSPHITLCESCYVDGKFPANLFSGDFILKTKVEAKEKEPDAWTEQESLLLLEGLEMHPSDWTAVSQHVGTRTRDECILHFLHLPLEDPYSVTTVSELGMLQYKLSKEIQGENPVMSVVAFLASTVDADVAAAAARTTFKKLGMSSNEPRVKKETETGEMDVDKKKESATEDEQEEEEDKAISGEEKAAATAPVPNYEEEKRISKLTCQFIGKQVEKFEMRLAQFQELEAVVEVEKRHIERERHQLYQDRTNFKKIQYEVQAEIAKRQPPPQPQPAIPNGMSPAQLQQLSMQQQQQQQQPIPGQLAYAQQQQQQQQFMRAQQYRDMMLQQQQQSMPPYHGYNSMRMQ